MQSTHSAYHDGMDSSTEARAVKLEAEITRAAQIIANSDYAVAMTGAGMSVESGIPPFRGTGGSVDEIWHAFDGWLSAVQVRPRRLLAEADQRARSMTTFWNLRNSLRDAKPHAGHFALAALVNKGYIKSVITQNIDGLDIKAGIGDALIEIHGNRSRLRCIGCAKRTDLNDFVPLFIPRTL